MAPKKKAEAEEKTVLMGRIGTNLKIGIVGLPNVGKSTFFNVLTKQQAAAENFPFCTVDPNESRAPVPDARYDFLVDYFKPLSKQPAYLKVVDIAGLVKGAHEGLGLGNAFLSNISACDAIFHMLRAFSDEDVTHVEGDVNPCRDLDIIHEELRLKDVEYLDKTITHLEKHALRANDKQQKIVYDILLKVRTHVKDNEKAVRFGTWTAAEIEELNNHLFLTAKPMIYLVNLSEKDFIRKKNKWLPKIKAWIDEHDPGSTLIPFSGVLETDMAALDVEAKEQYIKDHPGASSVLDKIIVTGYKALQLCYFFTVGADEVKAWTIQVGTKAPAAAGRIHTDFQKGFIMAEIMSFNDFKEEGSENAVKAAGKYKQKGRDHVVQDGDIIHFKFNAGAGLTGKKK